MRSAAIIAFAIALSSCTASPRRPTTLNTPPFPSITPSERPSSGHGSVAGLSFADALHGYALVTLCAEADCSSEFYATSDGGVTWMWLEDFSPGHELGFVRAASAREVWFYDPEAMVSRDGGRSFQQAPSGNSDSPGYPSALEPVGSSVWRFDRVHGCFFEVCEVALYQSTNGGRSWSRARGQPFSRAWRVQLVRSGFDRAWVIASGEGGRYDGPIYVTADGARTWKSLENPCAKNAYDFLVRLGEFHGVIYLICGAKPKGSQQRKITFRSVDGGLHWSVPYPGPESGSSFSMAVSSAESVWLSMPGSPVGASEDAGMTWGTRLNYKTNTNWGPIFFADPSHGWVAYANEVFRTSDAGHHWRAVSLPPPRFS